MDLRVVKSGSKLTLSQKLTLVFAAKETQGNLNLLHNGAEPYVNWILLADLATFFRVPSVSSCPLASSSRLHLVKGAVNGATSTIEANTESSVALVSPSPFPESLTYNLKKLAQPLTLSMKFPKQGSCSLYLICFDCFFDPILQIFLAPRKFLFWPMPTFSAMASKMVSSSTTLRTIRRR